MCVRACVCACVCVYVQKKKSKHISIAATCSAHIEITSLACACEWTRRETKRSGWRTFFQPFLFRGGWNDVASFQRGAFFCASVRESLHQIWGPKLWLRECVYDTKNINASHWKWLFRRKEVVWVSHLYLMNANTSARKSMIRRWRKPISRLTERLALFIPRTRGLLPDCSKTESTPKQMKQLGHFMQNAP